MSFKAIVIALGVVVMIATAGCGFTPVPQPPPSGVLNLEKVTGTVSLDGGVRRVRVVGEPDASISDAEIWLVNLDSVAPAAVTTVASDGSFEVTIDGDDGHEVRLQVRIAGTRSTPFDLMIVDGASPEEVHRSGCLSMSPSHELDFGDVEVGGDGPASVVVENSCDGELIIDAVRGRVALSPVVDTSTPITIGAGVSAQIDLRLTPTEAGLVEEVLFIDISGAATERLPLTWFGMGVTP